MYEYRGINNANQLSFGCSCHAIGALITTLQGFPYDIKPIPPAEELTPNQLEQKKIALKKLDADLKKWSPGSNYTAGSAVFCLVTKMQLDAKAVLEKNGFELLGMTASSHLFKLDNEHLKEFAEKLDANEVIYLMGKGWFHPRPEPESICEGEGR